MDINLLSADKIPIKVGQSLDFGDFAYLLQQARVFVSD
jgi:hypothetical protein